MTKKLLFVFTLFFVCFHLNSQEIVGTILNKNNKQPIEKVALITNLNKGYTSDKNGRFTLNISNVNTITFSCLGYISLTLKIEDLKQQDFVVYLEEQVNELDEIELNLAKVSLDSILIKSQKSMKNNYISGTHEYEFYAKENTKINFRKLDLELEKSSLLSRASRKLAEQEFNDYATNLKTSNPDVSTEFYGTIQPQKVYSEKLKKHYNKNKIDSVTGYSTLKNKKQITIKDAQKGLQNIVLKHLNKDQTYRVSSGLFKIEDSLSMKEVLNDVDSLDIDKNFNPYQPMYHFNESKFKASFFNLKKQNNFFNAKYYEHTLEQNEILGSNMLYVVGFSPRKSKSKYSGKMYINPKDFSISKLEYEFADGKRGQNVNLKWLLGIKVSEDINNVTLFYEKNEEDKIYLAYYKESRGAYAYIHRPIKFKENSSTNNKVKFDIKIELDTKETKEIFFAKVSSFDKSKIKSGKEKEGYKKKYAFLSLADYQKTAWQNRQLIVNYLKKYE